MTPGTVILNGSRAFVMLGGQGTLCVVAPVAPHRTPRYAGDVEIDDRHAVRCAGVALTSVRGWQSIGHLPPEIVAECQLWATRCTLTARVVAQAAPLASWHREAANERSAVR